MRPLLVLPALAALTGCGRTIYFDYHGGGSYTLSIAPVDGAGRTIDVQGDGVELEVLQDAVGSGSPCGAWTVIGRDRRILDQTTTLCVEVEPPEVDDCIGPVRIDIEGRQHRDTGGEFDVSVWPLDLDQPPWYTHVESGPFTDDGDPTTLSGTLDAEVALGDSCGEEEDTTPHRLVLDWAFDPDVVAHDEFFLSPGFIAGP